MAKTKKTLTGIVKDVKVTRAKKISDNCVMFTITVLDAVEIRGMKYVKAIDAKGEPYYFISFPQYKGTDGKYYNHCWFDIAPGMAEMIKAQVIEKLKESK